MSIQYPDMALPPEGLAAGMTMADAIRRKRQNEEQGYIDPTMQTYGDNQGIPLTNGQGLPPADEQNAGQRLQDANPPGQPLQPSEAGAALQDANPANQPLPPVEVLSPHERAINDMRNEGATDATGIHYHKRGPGTVALDALKGAGIALLQGGSPILGAGAGAAGIFRQQGLERDIAQHEDRYSDQDRYQSAINEAAAKRQSEKSVQDDRLVKEQQRQQSINASEALKEATAQNYKDVIQLKNSGQLMRDKQQGGKLAEAKADDVRQLMNRLDPTDPNFQENRKVLNDTLNELLSTHLPDAATVTDAQMKGKAVNNAQGGTSVINPALPNAPAVDVKNADGTAFRPLPRPEAHGKGGSGRHGKDDGRDVLTDRTVDSKTTTIDPNTGALITSGGAVHTRRHKEPHKLPPAESEAKKRGLWNN